MLIGAHVSTSGGISTAIGRAQGLGCKSMQIFNQSPRMWRPTNYGETDFEQFRDSMGNSPIEAVVIHAVYLINCASKEPEIRKKSLASLTQALHVGDGIDAAGVVLHPGSTKGEPLGASMDRVADALVKVLTATKCCPILLENTAGAGGTLGRDFMELSELIKRVEKRDKKLSKRVGVCLDSCHLFASGHDFTTTAKMKQMLDDFDRQIGIERLKCIHLNDSKTALGSNRDRHENLGDGEIGKSGLKAFLSDKRLAKLPVILEVPGDGDGPTREQVATAKRFYKTSS